MQMYQQRRRQGAEWSFDLVWAVRRQKSGACSELHDESTNGGVNTLHRLAILLAGLGSVDNLERVVLGDLERRKLHNLFPSDIGNALGDELVVFYILQRLGRVEYNPHPVPRLPPVAAFDLGENGLCRSLQDFRILDRKSTRLN